MQRIWQSVVVAAIVTIGWQCNDRAVAVTSVDRIQPSVEIAGKLAQSRRSICANMAFRNNAGILHQGKLMLNKSGNGSMQVEYFSASKNRTEVIIQLMTIQDSPYGILIVGSNPVYAGTRIRNPTYHPDNFLLKVQENGDYLFFAFDGQGTRSPVDVTDCR
jgi:hypothetical protein